MPARRFTSVLSLIMLTASLLAACQAATPIASEPFATQLAQSTQVVAQTQVVEVAVTSAAPNPSLAPQAGQMIIKNADLELLVPHTDLALDQVTLLAADHGGYLISSQTWFDGDNKHGTLSLGVPATQFEAVLNRLRHVGTQVLRETTSGQDVSGEYADLQARLTNLEATSARVRTFLENATTVTESLAVNAELSSLQGQIEQIKGQMQYYEGRAAFSTVTVTLTPERAPAEPTPDEPWKPQETFAAALDTLTEKAQALADGLIWFTVVGGPGLLILAIPFGVLVLFRRLRRK